MTRVFIIAPTAALRAGLRALISGATTQVAGDAPAFPASPAALASSDVVVLADETLLGDAAQALGDDGNLALLVLADDIRATSLLRRLPLRGWGIVSPDAAAAELQAAVEAVAQGMITLPKPLAELLFSQRAVVEELEEPLTSREREVLDLLSQGLPNKLIANQLRISEHTVKFHISSIFTKLGATSRTEAVSRGARRGLITL